MGFLDLLTVLVMILYHLEIVETRLLFSFIAYLIIKMMLFKEDPASTVDFVIAMYLLFMILKPLWILTIVSSIYLTQKGIVSLIN